MTCPSCDPENQMITKDQLAASMLHEDVDIRANARALAGLRIAVGVLFLIFGLYKVCGPEFTRAGGGFELTIRFHPGTWVSTPCASFARPDHSIKGSPCAYPPVAAFCL